MKSAQLLLVAALTAPGPADGQDAPRPRPDAETLAQFWLEQSYVSVVDFGMPEPLILEANLAPQLYFGLSGNDGGWRRFLPDALTLSPKVNLRIFSDESSPIRAPSFMPQASLYWWGGELLASASRFLFLRFVHHSNGEDGEFYLPDGSHNYDGGSFSTNFFELGLVSLFETPSEDDVWGDGWLAAGLALEVHPGFGMDDELDTGYGRVRLKGRTAWTTAVVASWHARFDWTVTYRMASFPGVAWWEKPRWSLDSRVSLYGRRIPAAGLWLGFYWGPDYYNLGFDRFIGALRIGASFDFLAFNRPRL